MDIRGSTGNIHEETAEEAVDQFPQRDYASASSGRRRISRRPRNSAANLGVLFGASDFEHEEVPLQSGIYPSLQQYIHQNLEEVAIEEGSDDEETVSPEELNAYLRRRIYPSDTQRIAGNNFISVEEQEAESTLNDFSLVPFTEVIPMFWREEILEPPDSPLKQPVMYAVMQGFGSLACLLYTRILRLCKECKEDRS